MATFVCKCHWCGKELVRATQAKSRNVRLHFCTRKGCKAEYQKSFKPVTKEWLHEHYIVQRLNTTEIAHMVGRDPKSVWNWLKDFKIPTRPRGGNTLPHAFTKGCENPFKGKNHSEETKKKMSERAKAEGRLPYKPENGPPWKGVKGSAHPSWKGGHTPERQAFYLTDEWKDCARIVKKRDKYTCQRCGKKKKTGDGQPFDLHHIVGFACVELRAVVSNLVYLCESCHYWVHSKGNTDQLFISEPKV